MLNSTLLNILSKFSSREIKDFGEFVCSPFYNKNENVIKLFNYIKKYHPDFNDKRLEKEYVYRKLYSKGKYNDGFMRTVIFNLGKLSEDYLAHTNFTKDDMKKGISLLDELNERKLGKVFLKYFNEIEKDIEGLENKGEDYFYLKYQLQRQMEIYTDWSKFKNKDFINYTQGVKTYIDDDLTSYYLSKVLNHYRFILDRISYEPMEYNSEFVDMLIDYLLNKDNHFKKKTVIKLHLYEVLLQKDGNEEYFRILKDVLKNEKSELSHSDLYSLHNILQTYCIGRVYAGDEKYNKERTELYKVCLDRNLFAATEHIYFDDLLFANIALTSIRTGDYEWANYFIEKYKDMLSPENSEVVINYTLARLLFSKGDYGSALKHLNDIKTIKHIQFKLPIRDLSLMVYYELGMFSQSNYQIDSYRHFLVNNKQSLSETRYSRIGSFLKFYTKLIKAREKNSISDVKKINAELKLNPNVLERNWLISKINELINV